MSFVRELKRRSVFRVAAAYLVVAWLLIQIASTVSNPLNLPEWFETFVIVLLAIGFPVAILLAWAFELTPDGIKVTQSNSGGEVEQKQHWLDYALVAGLAAVAVAIVADQLGSRLTSEQTEETDRYIAVLPFVDLSEGGGQQHFGDGLTEELLHELTRLHGLRVAGRSASFALKQGENDLREIAETLNVSSILQGSVRKDGDRLRISVQLVNTSDGHHIWSNIYERPLADIFAVQDEIAAAVAGALGVSLGVGDVNAFRGAGTTNVKAYEAYLRAKYGSAPMRTVDRIRALERATELDPQYAAAWAELGIRTASTMWNSSPQEAPAILDRAIPHLLRAVELEPNSAYAYSLLATVSYPRMDWIASEKYYAKALEISPDGEALNNYGNMLMRTGRSTDAVRFYEAAARAERIPLAATKLRVNAYLALGKNDVARGILRQLAPHLHARTTYFIALSEGESFAIKKAIRELTTNDVAGLMLWTPVLRDFDSGPEVLATLRSLYDDQNIIWPSKYHDVALLAAYFGDSKLSLEAISVEARLTPIRLGALWYPVMRGVRKLPAFKELVTDLNLVDYWRNFGWPDHCKPTGKEAFDCR